MEETIPKSSHASSPSSSKVMDAVRKFSSMASSSPASSSIPKPGRCPVESRYQQGQIQSQTHTLREDDRHDVNNQRGDDADFDNIDPIEANKILTDHIEVLQHDCDIMSDILERVDHRLGAVERNSQALLDIVSNNDNKNSARKHKKTTTTNALLCRLEAVDAYISSLQDIIDTQHVELQHLKGERNLKEDTSGEHGGNSKTTPSNNEATNESLDSSLSFQQLQSQYIRKIDLIAKLQDENEIKDVQIHELQTQLEELQLQHAMGMKKNNDMTTKRRIFRL